MAAPTLAEFTTASASVNPQVFTNKDLQCLRILAFALLGEIGVVTPATNYSGTLNTANSLLMRDAEALIGKIADERMPAAMVKMLLSRASRTGDSASTLLALVKGIRNCNQYQLDHMEGYIVSSFLESCGL